MQLCPISITRTCCEPGCEPGFAATFATSSSKFANFWVDEQVHSTLLQIEDSLSRLKQRAANLLADFFMSQVRFV